MAGLENDGSNKQTTGNDIHEEANIYEDEINLIDYFLVLRKRKYIILLGSVLPAFIVGLILFFGPRNYKVTYVYDVKDQSVYVKDQSAYVKDQSVYVKDQSVYVKDQSAYDVSNWNLNEKNYNVLLDRFYSAENIEKIVSKLREKGLDRYAGLIGSARNDLKKFLGLGVLPPYMDLSKVKITDPAKLEQVRQLRALLLKLTIVGRPKNDIPKVALVIRDDFENVIPVYLVQEQLNTAIRGYRTKMADIEENRFNLELALKTNKSVLEKLKNIKSDTLNESTNNVTLQFDVGSRSEYLPLGYQVRAAEARIIEIEETVRANEGKYEHNKDLLALNEKLFAELKDITSSYYTIQQFHSFLTDLVDSYKSEESRDYLSSYIKKIENRISVSAPVTEKPKVYAVPRGTVKKIAIVFVISLMISIFAAFLSEGMRKNKLEAA